MEDEEKIKEMAINLRGMADILDKILVLAEKEEQGEDTKEELENLLGQYAIKTMRIKGIF